MIKYHPDTRFLTEYAAGCLPRPRALCVAAHLHYCPHCKRKLRDLTNVGAALFMSQEPAAVSGADFERLMRRIDELPEEAAPPPEDWQAPASPILPAAIHHLAGGDLERLKWRALGKSFRFFTLLSDAGEGSSALLHIRAGGRVPSHRHTGDEITVVLKGSFSDREDYYHLGDFVVRSGDDTHSPVASQHEDCLCLAALEAPITMTSWFHRLMQPLMGRRTA